jgi:S1-C subfamily serine protease
VKTPGHGYSGPAVRTAAASLASAIAAALLALGIAHWGGWLGGSSRTVVVPEAVPAASATAVGNARALPGRGFDPGRLYRLRSPGVVTIYAEFATTEAQGSGFVVTRDGAILTSSHVITNAGELPSAGARVTPASRIYVEFADHDRVAARIVGWDVFDDVGVVKVDPKAHALVPVPLGRSSDLRVGQPVAVIGSPFGNENSLDVGVVSGIRRSIDSVTSTFRLSDAIQIDAAITHGNSGGPVFDASGRVIGIAAQIRTDTGQPEGVGFAVPIDSARRSLAQLLTTGKVSYAFVGVRTIDLTPTIARALRLPVARGALVVKVDAGTAAAHAGIRGGTGGRTVNGIEVRTGGDVIVAIGGRAVATGEDVSGIVAERLHPGQTVPFTLLRDGRRIVVPVTLGTRTP